MVSQTYANRWARRQESMLCIDGQRRTDCVIVLEAGHGGADDILCGKPMVGIVAWPGRVAGAEGTNWGARMCLDHFEQFTHDLDTANG